MHYEYEDDRNPFEVRILDVIRESIESEWEMRQSVRAQAITGSKSTRAGMAEDDVILTVETLAHKLENISVSTLRREMKALGMRPAGVLIREARLEYAKRLLITTRITVGEVGKRAGYDDEKHFSGTFARATGKSPSEFRSKSRGKTRRK